MGGRSFSQADQSSARPSYHHCWLPWHGQHWCVLEGPNLLACLFIVHSASVMTCWVLACSRSCPRLVAWNLRWACMRMPPWPPSVFLFCVQLTSGMSWPRSSRCCETVPKSPRWVGGSAVWMRALTSLSTLRTLRTLSTLSKSLPSSRSLPGPSQQRWRGTSHWKKSAPTCYLMWWLNIYIYIYTHRICPGEYIINLAMICNVQISSRY